MNRPNIFHEKGNLTATNANGTVTTNTWTYDNRLRTVTGAGTTNFIWDGQDVPVGTD